jgi:hypothetical protein
MADQNNQCNYKPSLIKFINIFLVQLSNKSKREPKVADLPAKTAPPLIWSGNWKMKKFVFVSPTWSNPEKSRDCMTSGTGDPNLVIHNSKSVLS